MSGPPTKKTIDEFKKNRGIDDLTQMQSAWQEVMASPEYQAQKEEQDRFMAERERLAVIPVILSVTKQGYAKKPNSDPEYMFLLEAPSDCHDRDQARCWMRVSKEHTEKFVPEPLEFIVELPNHKDIADEAEWLSEQDSVQKWSVCMKITSDFWAHTVTNRVNKKQSLVFSFSKKEVAALFRMMFAD